MSTPQVLELYKVSEGNDKLLTFVTDLDTTDLVITARYRISGGTGSGTQFGTVNGDVAGTKLSMGLATGVLVTGLYDVELYADYGGASQTLIKPSDNGDLQIQIVERFGND